MKCANGNLDTKTGICLVNDQPCIGVDCEVFDRKPRTEPPPPGFGQVYQLLDRASKLISEIEQVIKNIEKTIDKNM